MKNFLISFFFGLPFLVLAQNEETLAKKYAQTADSLFQIGRYEDAISENKKALAIFKKYNNKEARLTIQNQLAEVYIKQARFDDALFELEYLEAEKDSKLNAQGHNLAGLCFLNKGRNDLAEAHFKSSLGFFTEIYGETHEKTALCLNNLGIVFWNTGNNELAMEHHQKALDIRKKIYGQDHQQVADSYNNIGLTLGQTAEALNFYEQALEIYKKKYGEDSPELSNTYNNIAIIKRQTGEYLEALINFEKVLKIWQKVYPNNHPNEAFVYTNIGQIHFDEQNFELALSYQQKALKIYEQNYGRKHPEIANTHNLLGIILLQKQEYEKALFHFQEALIANVVDFDEKNTQKNPTIEKYYKAELLAVSLMLKAQAFEAKHLNKSLKINDLEAALNSLYLADQLLDHIRNLRSNQNDKIALGKLSSEIYETAIRICFQRSEYAVNASVFFKKAFYFIEKSKSVTLLSAISDTKAKHFVGIPDSLLAQEKQIQSDIAFYEQKIEKSEESNATEIRKILFDLNRKYEIFTKKLELSFPEYYNLKFNIHIISADSLQKIMPEETTLLNYFIGKERVFVLAVSKKKIQGFNFPKVANLDILIRKFRNGMYFHISKIYTESAFELYKYLIPTNLKTKKLVIIPDGELATMPFEALLSRKATSLDYTKHAYLIQNYECAYAFSATLYAQTYQKNELEVKEIFLAAPVNFVEGLNSLPASETEVKEIAQLFEKKGLKISQFLFEKAQEQIMKTNDLKKYQILHLASHGIVNEKQPELSQLFFNPSPNEDGNLYAGEIYNLGLQAELVTLSACQTGLGQISKGEGIIGLSRALLYAGAKNMLVSLWKVADNSTSDLMIDFYKNSLGNYRFSSSLRTAKLQMIQGKYAEPYFWSPFILIGQ